MSSMNQGKDPPLNLIHKSRADANNYVGRPGQMTLVGDYTDGNTPRLLEARFHNGLLPGGFIMPLTPAPQGNDPAVGPAPRIMLIPPKAYVAEVEETIVHNFGYFPTVRGVRNDGEEMFFASVHHDENSLTITHAGGTYSLMLS